MTLSFTVLLKLKLFLSQKPLYSRKFRCGTHTTFLPSMYLEPMPVSFLIEIDSPHINLDKTKVKAESYINISGVNLDSRSSSCHCYESTRIPIPKSEVWHECSVCPKMLHYLYSLKANVLLISFINISAIFTAQKCTSYPQSSKSFLSLWG